VKRALLCFAVALAFAAALTFGCAYWKPDPSLYLGYSSRFQRTYLLDKWIDEHKGKEGFWAGAAMRDVTPKGSAYIAGFGPNRRSEGVLDPVYCHAIFMSDGSTSIVFVSFDFVGIMASDVWKIRDLVTEKHPRSVLVAATHNHEGPDSIGMWGPGLLIPFDSGVDQRWMDWVRVEAAKAVDDAVRSAQSAKLRFGSITVPPGISENLWFPRQQDKKDNELTTIQAVEAESGKPIFTLVNYACHVEALFGHNKLISSDLAGRLYKYLIEAGQGVPVFVAGAVGGMIIPYPNLFEERRNFKQIEKRIEWIEWAGKELADLSVEALEGGETLDTPSITHITKDITIPMENPLFRYLFENKIVLVDTNFLKQEGKRKYVLTEVHAIELGPAQIATIPGEIFPSIGFAIKGAMSAKYRFVFGLTNDEYGYMMRASEWDDPKLYSYERSVSLGKQAGPTVERTAIELISELGRTRVGR